MKISASFSHEMDAPGQKVKRHTCTHIHICTHACRVAYISAFRIHAYIVNAYTLAHKYKQSDIHKDIHTDRHKCNTNTIQNGVFALQHYGHTSHREFEGNSDHANVSRNIRIPSVNVFTSCVTFMNQFQIKCKYYAAIILPFSPSGSFKGFKVQLKGKFQLNLV